MTTPRERPLLMVHTGDGKGKTSAAMGVALRGWAQGWSVCVVQFVKSASWRTGEQAAFEALDRTFRRDGLGGPVAWYREGAGFSWGPASTRDDAGPEAARASWERVREMLAREEHRLYVLDELTYPLAWGWLDTEDVVRTLTTRPGLQHVVVTGRRCPQPLLDAADLISDVAAVRHPLADGHRGQAGIEW